MVIRFDMQETEISTSTFFSDLLIIELASVLAGPSAGLFFAECGARVIKIENSTSGGDVTRTWYNSKETPGNITAYYASVNQGKEIKMLDLSDLEQLLVLEVLLAQADIVLSNFKPASARRLNLEASQIRKRFPRLIVGQIDAFGEDDPRVAYDIVLQAEAGYLSMCGTEETPARLPVALIDILAGHQLKEGVLLALMHRTKTGEGCIVRVNLLEAALGALANQAGNYLMTGMIPKAQGTLHPNIAPYGEWFRCGDDKRLILAIGNDRQFERLTQCLGLETLSSDERFKTNALRVINRSALADCLRPAFKKHVRDFWTKALHALQVPCGALLSLEEVFQGEARNLIQESVIENTLTKAVRTVNFQLKK